ncbi:Glutamate 5-kinase [Microbotryomycetes sp. JL201]|nr:Glutamate 5-kinase [Microbotryomycetes sp. JL201]
MVTSGAAAAEHSASGSHQQTVVIKLGRSRLVKSLEAQDTDIIDAQIAGSSSILHPEPPYAPQISTLSALVETCVSLRAHGYRVVIVSSGAIAMGLHRMDLPALAPGKKRPIGEKQALAAIGQGRLIALWDQLFGMLGQPIAQILITRNDIADRSRYLNATTTLSTLLSLGVIPIINENDTISVSEILHINKFGDNDTLSAIAAGMCGADYLFLLTDVEGLYEDNPRKVPGARLVSKVRDIDEVRRMVSTATLGSSLGTGGMETKIIAAELATAVGCATIITLGSSPQRILPIVQAHARAANTAPSASPLSETSTSPVEFATPQSLALAPAHTMFLPKSAPLTSRRFWILHGLTPRGTIYVDEGAYRAISKSERDGGGGGNGGRLLAAGVLKVEGTFAAGQAVRVCVVRGRKGRKQSSTDEGGSRSMSSSLVFKNITQGSQSSGAEPSRPGSPDHFADRTGALRDLTDSVDSLHFQTDPTAQSPATGSAELHHDELRVDIDPIRQDEEIFEFGRGLTNYNSVEIDRVKGLRRQVITRWRCSSDIQKVLGYSEAEHVVESVVETTHAT